jgi:glycosyltransferase involved in cell wall biosynthesis
MDKVLTVIIPTYNAAAYLEKGLQSLVIEDRALFEKLDVLVVDDGSTDQSAEIAQGYIERYPEVFRIYRKENGGHGSGINVGAKMAKGKYFKVLDADDWVDSTGFVAYVRKLEGIDADAVITPYQRYDISDGKTEDLISHPLQYGINYDLNEVMDQWLSIHPDMHFWGVTYRTDFYRALDYQVLEHVFYEDQEYATVPLSYAESVCYLEDIVYIYRVGDVNQSVFGDTQVKRCSHLEAVIYRMLEQEMRQSEMPAGGDRYWRKKTAMVITGYYQIMLLKNKDKAMGRKAVTVLNANLEQVAPDIYAMVARKCKGFLLFSYLHISNGAYEYWAPRLIGWIRKIKGQKV